MKLVVYGILRDEIKNIEPWLDVIVNELRPDDSLFLLDTGSTDGTLEVLNDRFNKNIHPNFHFATAAIDPWRFDTARNTALALVDPTADLAWSLDLDEYPVPGWRQAIEDSGWEPSIDRLRYKFIWSFTEDGDPDVTFYSDKLHARHGFKWQGLAHEWLSREEGVEHQHWVPGLEMHHHQDTAIDRRNRDMELMTRAIKEFPDDPRLQHYYARQLFFVGRMVEAAAAFQRHLANPEATWRHERSESMLYLARTGGNDAWAHQWLYRALAECPERKETWFAAAQWEYDQGDHGAALAMLGKATGLPEERYYLSDGQIDAKIENLRHMIMSPDFFDITI